MTKKRRMPVNVLQGARPAEADDSVLDGIVGGGGEASPAQISSSEGEAPAEEVAPILREPSALSVDGAGAAAAAGCQAPCDRARVWAEGRRLRRAEEIVRARVLVSTLVGLVPWTPLALAALVGIHLSSIRALAWAYRIPLERNLGRGAVASLLGTGAALAAARAAAAALAILPIPVWPIGVVCLGAAAAASTYLVGRVFVKHFEAGETLLSLDPTATRDYFRRTLG